MKLIIAAALAATAISTIAAPALAQPYGPPPPPPAPHDWHPGGPGGPGFGGPGAPGGWDIDRRIDWVQDRIARGRADGSLDRREAFRAQRALDGIRAEERRDRYHNGGRLNDGDRIGLQGRLDQLNDRLHWMRQNDVRRPW
jgi:hypothetical protein